MQSGSSPDPRHSLCTYLKRQHCKNSLDVTIYPLLQCTSCHNYSTVLRSGGRAAFYLSEVTGQVNRLAAALARVYPTCLSALTCQYINSVLQVLLPAWMWCLHTQWLSISSTYSAFCMTWALTCVYWNQATTTFAFFSLSSLYCQSISGSVYFLSRSGSCYCWSRNGPGSGCYPKLIFYFVKLINF
jgi:hypothetical protein